MGDKENTSFRLSKKARLLLKVIAKEDGLTMTGVLESAIRQIAEQKGIKYKDLSDED